jgi:hypothetical protein
MGAGSKLLVGFVFLGLMNFAQAQTLRPLPIAVKDNRCTFVLTSIEPDEQYYLVIGSLARQGGLFRVQVRTEAAYGPESLPVEAPAMDPDWIGSIQALRERLARARSQGLPVETKSGSVSPPPQKVFHLLTGAGGLQDQVNYTAIVADLRAVGRSCQAYVDRASPDPAKLRPVLEDAVHVFDEEIYPKTTRLLGRVLDVDRDGRFTLLFTPWLGKLQNGKVAVDGFVRGSDF